MSIDESNVRILLTDLGDSTFNFSFFKLVKCSRVKRSISRSLKYGSKYSDYTESSAYHFTINLLKSHGQDYSGFLNQFYNYGGKFPGIFNWTDAIKNIVNFKK